MRPPSPQDTDPETLIDPEIRAEIGDPVPVAFAAQIIYVPLLVVSVALCVFVTHTLPGPLHSLLSVVADLLIGAATALLMVLFTWVLGRSVAALQDLEREFQKMLGRLRPRTIIGLAALSGVTEELLFRGFLQPWLGYAAASLLFGALHFSPSRIFIPWTLFAFVSGFIFGALFVWRDSLLPPIVAHVLLNGINLHLIVTGRRVPLSNP